MINNVIIISMENEYIMRKILNEIIIEERKKLGISIRELARRLDIDNAYLSKIESGKIKKPSIKLLADISDELNISFFQLLISCYNLEELEMLNITNADINLGNNLIDEKLLNKMYFIDENGNKRISLKKTLNYYKDNKINEKETIGILSCIVNKNLFNYLSKNELNDMEK